MRGGGLKRLWDTRRRNLLVVYPTLLCHLVFGGFGVPDQAPQDFYPFQMILQHIYVLYQSVLKYIVWYHKSKVEQNHLTTPNIFFQAVRVSPACHTIIYTDRIFIGIPERIRPWIDQFKWKRKSITTPFVSPRHITLTVNLNYFKSCVTPKRYGNDCNFD